MYTCIDVSHCDNLQSPTSLLTGCTTNDEVIFILATMVFGVTEEILQVGKLCGIDHYEPLSTINPDKNHH